VKAQVVEAKRVYTKVVLELNESEYDSLISFLTWHSTNRIIAGHVLGCESAATFLEMIEKAVENGAPT
jgi:hypothetical protein